MPCSNSVLLSKHDRALLEYFPETTVYYIHSIRRLDPLEYLFRETAASSSMVMHMILALSASEMCRKGLSTGYKPTSMDVELYHYTAALKQLQDLVGKSEIWRQGGTLEQIVAAVFLMVYYGLQPNSSPGHAKTHVTGMWSLVDSYIRSSLAAKPNARNDSLTLREAGLSPLSSRLFLWTLYAVPLPTFLPIHNVH
jgi:hypothetical protein